MTWSNDNPAISKKAPRVKSLNWGTVEAYQQWCDVDHLHGDTLIEGEELEVLWPDGSYEGIKVHLVDKSYDISDMGHPYRVGVLKAYADTTYHGTRALIPLVGLKVRRL